MNSWKLKQRSPVLGCLNLFCFLTLLSILPLSISRSNFQLKRGDSISVEKESDFISSPDNSFTCGFYSLGTNAYHFSIWFTNSLQKTVVWTANRDRPVYSKGSKLTLRRDGAMVLTDIDGTIVWQTNTSTTNVAALELLNTGNLVLKNPQGNILWQSFDSPTDTLLPFQSFTKTTRLTSALRTTGFESGYYNLYFGSDNVLRLISDTPDTSFSYWPNPDFGISGNGRPNYNGSRVAMLDDMGRFLSSDQLQINASDMGYGVERRLTLDYDGNLRIYSLGNSTGLWDVTWQALANPCDVRGVCGRVALCVSAVENICNCPPGFVVSDPNDWNKGCKATFNSSLLKSRQVKFMKIAHADYYGFDLYTVRPVTFDRCREICREDFRCLAFSYRVLGEGLCFIKSALFNGNAHPEFPGTIYIRLPDGMATPSRPNVFHASKIMCGSRKRDLIVGSPTMYDDFSYKKVRWVYVYSFAGILGAIELMIVVTGWWFLFKNSVPASVEAGYQMVTSQFRRYSYSELKKATGDFKKELGRGGSGTVYKGVVHDDRIVAVKRLGDAFQSQDEYFAEISTLGRINHMNLVRILGFCSDKRHRLLVYEYIENLSQDRHLFGPKFLSWKQRYAVALGMAKGLAYLHHECLEWVIHCDMKPENILLDSEFQPKIADFGLAKLLQRDNPGFEFTRIRGTKGYMAPEWTLNLPITAKVDVFGFGVVILEIIRGVRVYNWVVDDDDDNQESGLANFVRKTKAGMQTGGWLSWVGSVVDPRLEGKFSRNQAAMLIQTGIACVEEDRNKRPTMASVVQTLLECEDETEM